MEPAGFRGRVPPSILTALGAGSSGQNLTALIYLKDEKESEGFQSLLRSHGVRTVCLGDITDVAVHSGPLIAIMDEIDDLVIARLFQDNDNMPVILVVENSESALKEAYHYGADFVVPRPFDLENPIGFRGY